MTLYLIPILPAEGIALLVRIKQTAARVALEARLVLVKGLLPLGRPRHRLGLPQAVRTDRLGLGPPVAAARRLVHLPRRLLEVVPAAAVFRRLGPLRLLGGDLDHGIKVNLERTWIQTVTLS
jgi:hypothetical protein